MKNDFYNAEGYADPTAGAAIRNTEFFQVNHPSGYVRIRPEFFFPCTIARGRKFFRLVRRYCSQAQQEELLTLMLARADSLAKQAIRLDTQLDALSPDRAEYEDTLLALKHTKTDHSRMVRLIREFTTKGG